MLLSKTIQEWDETYNQAVKVLEANPNSVSILLAIHQNPSYYAGYYLKEIKGNTDHLGSVTADKNHSINAAIIGKGSSMSIVDQISALFSKNQCIARNQRKTRDELYISTVNYSSYHGGKEGADDVYANIYLTNYAYQKLLLSLPKKSYLQHRYKPNGSFISWTT